MSRFHNAIGLFLVLFSAPAAASQAIDTAVEKLGSLSGIALHCKYMDEVRRTKAAVVDNVATKRHYGAIFENATNVSFLTAHQEETPCPAKEALGREVDAAIAELEKASAGQ